MVRSSHTHLFILSGRTNPKESESNIITVENLYKQSNLYHIPTLNGKLLEIIMQILHMLQVFSQ